MRAIRQETLPLPGDEGNAESKASTKKEVKEESGQQAGEAAPCTPKTASAKAPSSPTAAAALAAGPAAAAPPAAPAPAAADSSKPAEGQEKEKEGKKPMTVTDMRKAIFVANPGVAQAGPLVDFLMMQLQAFIFEVTMVNKGSVATPPTDRGHENLLISWEAVKSKEKGVGEVRQYTVHAQKMSKGITLNFCGPLTRTPKAMRGAGGRRG